MPDRIIGPLTMVQFVEAVVGGGAAYVCYMSLPSPLGMLCAALVALFVLAILFVKINERPFSHFLLSALSFLSTPKQRVWRRGSASNLNVEIYQQKKTQTGPIVTKNVSHEEIKEFAKSVDTANNIKS